MSLTRASCLVALLVLALAGCSAPRELPTAPGASCAPGCHGDSSSAAPPAGLWLNGGATSTAERGVGAHREHLAAQVPCSSCHLVPLTVDAVGHMDSPLPAEVTFSGVAVAQGVAASWSGETCAVYCHAPSRDAGGAVPAPRWTTVDGSQAKCGACHGLPPKGSHPAATGCHLCHGQVVNSAGQIIDAKLHVDGKVQLEGKSGCSACHGSSANAAPPLDTLGNNDPSALGVGAHQAHVRASAEHAAVPCSECHVMPTAVDSAGHMDSALPAEVTFGSLAKTGGLSPVWSAPTCSATYCHGGIDGGGNQTPEWNTGQRMVCGSCHGLPPAQGRGGGAHPAASLADCANCHPATVDASGSIIDAKRHVNGVVDFN